MTSCSMSRATSCSHIPARSFGHLPSSRGRRDDIVVVDIQTCLSWDSIKFVFYLKIRYVSLFRESSPEHRIDEQRRMIRVKKCHKSIVVYRKNCNHHDFHTNFIKKMSLRLSYDSVARTIIPFLFCFAHFFNFNLVSKFHIFS